MSDTEITVHATSDGKRFTLCATYSDPDLRALRYATLKLSRGDAELLLEKLTCALCENPEIEPCEKVPS